MNDKTYQGIEALIMMHKKGVCMGHSQTKFAHRVREGELEYWDGEDWYKARFELSDFRATDWRIVPDPSLPKPTRRDRIKWAMIEFQKQILDIMEAVE